MNCATLVAHTCNHAHLRLPGLLPALPRSYLGGVNWAILVAHICKLYPRGVPSVLVSRFFKAGGAGRLRFSGPARRLCAGRGAAATARCFFAALAACSAYRCLAAHPASTAPATLAVPQVYAQWSWPTPIMLRAIERDPTLAMPVW